MDQTDFAIVMVSGVLIIITLFLFILIKIFERKAKPSETALPDLNKIEPHEFQPEKFGIRPYEIEGLEKEFQLARDLQKMESVKEIIREKDIKEENLKGSTEPIKKILLSQPALHSIEDNEKLKLEDFLIDIQVENIQKKAKKKISSRNNLGKAEKLKERETPEKKPIKRAVQKKSAKDTIPEMVSKVSEEKSPRKKPGIKARKKEKKQAIVNENQGSGEL